jgi:hypothetical protein
MRIGQFKSNISELWSTRLVTIRNLRMELQNYRKLRSSDNRTWLKIANLHKNSIYWSIWILSKLHNFCKRTTKSLNSKACHKRRNQSESLPELIPPKMADAKIHTRLFTRLVMVVFSGPMERKVSKVCKRDWDDLKSSWWCRGAKVWMKKISCLDLRGSCSEWKIFVGRKRKGLIWLTLTTITTEMLRI